MQEQRSQWRGAEWAIKSSPDKDHNTEGKWLLTCCQTCTYSTTTTTGFHKNSSHSCGVSTRQAAWGKHEFSQNDGGVGNGCGQGAGEVDSCYKGGDYLGGCSGAQLLHCTGSESDAVASWCHWVWTTGLPPRLRRRRWWRADASGKGSPAQQPLKRDEREKREGLFSLGCVWAPRAVNRDNLIPLNNATTPANQKIVQKPEIIGNHLQLLSNSGKQLHRGGASVFVCVHVCAHQWDWYIQYNQLHSN